MHRNPVWLSFLGIIIVLTLFFSFQAGKGVWLWTSYSKQLYVRVLDWEIIQTKSGELKPQLRYLMLVGDEKKILTSVYKNKRFRNEWAANKFLDDVKNISTWEVWVRPSHLDSALLERSFPWKSVTYACLLFCLLAYFFWLGVYVVKLQKNS